MREKRATEMIARCTAPAIPFERVQRPAGALHRRSSCSRVGYAPE